MRAAFASAILVASALVGACDEAAPAGDGSATPALPAPLSYPPGPYGVAEGETLPDLAFEGVDAAGARATLRLASFHIGEAAAPRLLLIQVTGGLWCGTCRWTAEHLDAVIEEAAGGRVDRLDGVLRDRDNAPPDADRDAAGWRHAVGGARPTGVDPAFALAGALEGVAAPLPLLLVVDERTMIVEAVLSNPDPHELAERLGHTLAELDGRPAPASEPESLVRDLFHENEWGMLVAMAEAPGAPPPDPTNEVADSAAAASLGAALFFDAGLSPSGTISCATCHDPARGFSDDEPLAQGVASSGRRTPSITLAAHGRWQNWDGSADSLWAQALGPLENPIEMGSSRAFVAHRVLTAHGAAYRAAFPDAAVPDVRGWPIAGKPGDAVYDALGADEQRAITQVFVHAGKAIAAYERALRVGPTPLDRYVAGDTSALTDEELYGLVLYFRTGCAQCHWGPRLTDDAFHDTGVGVAAGDAGRSRGVDRWRASEFRGDGPWSHAPIARDVADAPEATARQFKTPSLRGVGASSFFGHAGGQHDLAGVTEAYGRPGEREPWLPTFTETAQWGLVPFLKTL